MISRRFTAVLALLAFTGAHVAVALHYGHHHEHGTVVLRDATSDATPDCPCGRHEHPPAAKSGEPGHSCPPQRLPLPGNDGRCLICQTLANKPLLADEVALISRPERVELRSVERPALPRSADRALHFSRGPPAA